MKKDFLKCRIKCKIKILFSFNYIIDALDVYTKINIKDYLARPEAKFDKEYSKERQKIGKYIREDDQKTKAQGNLID